MTRWAVMWTIAFALYGVCKWVTYWQARAQFGERDRRRVFGYLLAWPGMDAAGFGAKTDAVREQPSLLEWTIAGLKILLGVVLMWGVARWAWPEHPLVAGWIGMVGAMFILHFGVFHVLSLAWRRAGINAVPLMRSPMRDLARRVLGPAMEHWVPRTSQPLHIQAAAAVTRRRRRNADDVPGVRTDS